MFEIQIDDARVWKSCIDAIVNLIEEGTFEIETEGIRLRAMDPSQIAMVSFYMPKSAFSEYKVSSANRIGLNFENLSKIMARTRGGEKLSMSIDDNKLTLDFYSEESKRNFKVPLVEMPPGSHKDLKIEHDAIVTINASSLKEALRDAVLISSHITLEAGSFGFRVDAHGDNADLLLESGQTGDGIKVESKQTAKATFPLKYLDDISKGCPDNSKMTIHLKSNKPLKMEYKIGEADIVYFLAPRIDLE
ncbi:MAG: proliferating cell nuclear antigen (pcna) [Candidatus Micrarchaeota archaeon]